MKKLFLVVLLAFLTLTSYSQNEYIKPGPNGEAKFKNLPPRSDRYYYGPVPHRTLEETIGETYIVLPMDSFFARIGSKSLVKASEPENMHINKALIGKLLKLNSIDKDKNAHLTDSSGTEYIHRLVNGTYCQITPLFEITEAKRLFLNKTLWLNLSILRTGNPHNTDESSGQINNMRFQPVKIIDITLDDSNIMPLIFTAQTSDGKIGYTYATVSGTNSDLDPQIWFENRFFTKDPKLIYKYSPTIWANIKKGKITLGMTEKQVELIRNKPDQINKIMVSNRLYLDWIYMKPKYQSYLFLNGKVTMIKE